MSWSVGVNRARSFLTGRYTAKAILELIAPVRSDGIWIAKIDKNGCIVTVYFQRKGVRWQIVKET